MKVCTSCHIEKYESNFFFKDKAKNRLHTECKDCYREHRKTYHHEHYMKYGNAYRQRAKDRRNLIKRMLRLKITEYMSGKSCIYCGESEICALDFDHLDPSTKRFGISAAINKCYDWELILDEITRCRVLCANCHRKHTAVQNGWYKNIK